MASVEEPYMVRSMVAHFGHIVVVIYALILVFAGVWQLLLSVASIFMFTPFN